MKLSACMIAKDEEKNIARCIGSYKDSVDEIIVVDTGSVDKTVEIAETLGAKVYRYEWNNHFAEAKNYAIDRAKGDWIIFLDADEYFVNDTARNIVPLIRRLPAHFKAIACKMKNIDYTNGKLLDEITHVRIFRRDKNILYMNNVHECLTHKTKNKAIEAFLADDKDLLIYHEGYSLSDRGKKSRRNLELLLKRLDKAPEDPTIYQYISDCYFGMEEWEKSIEYARMFIASGARFVGYNVKPYQNVIDSMLRLKCNANDILEEIYAGVNKFPCHPSFHFYLANMLFDLKKYDKAHSEYKKTLTLQEKYDDIEINSIVPNLYHVYYYMAIIASHRNEHEDALSHFVESLKMEKMQYDCLRKLLLAIKSFPAEDIILLLNSIYNKEGKEDLDFIVTVLTGVSLPKVLAYYSALRIKKYGSEDLTVVYMLLANGQYNKTFAVAQKCLDADPDNRTFGTLAVVSALLSEHGEYMAWVGAQASEPMRRFVRGLTKHEIFVFSKEDKEDYLDLITYLHLFGTKEILNKAIELAQDFDEKVIYAELGNLFFKQECYAEALKLYQHYIKQEEAKKEKQITQIYAKGICWYKLREYEKAATALIEAYELGYRQNDIYEFLRWSVDKLPSGNRSGERGLEIIAESKWQESAFLKV
ncbi:glycosyl transferase family 2 [Desulfitobacterium hafniense DCB-2]|uniref:Glycosyl transferase family 2 n=1 Tax=Desulfitobacterium hafniense (strain DSM 10664 / DCB-2) TaxID=272564 RepID=B8FTV3_DESHD|nr:glycosyltransferase family 2 protein [Desulfitobacterium hafniense]ACL22195.1 glycosyl transferase family 2 [Desulfitobacterium hafniense DCB-2]